MKPNLLLVNIENSDKNNDRNEYTKDNQVENENRLE